ncbi:hypothetical protein [Actinacidiphila acidipaludis]|uniref:Uncharacterized protein n=1 Tax=Actinacidiphila acidipaludis TaxID=2873382 RepID=A0ABS7QDH8_9ACTN|nr:hypothetical protein [Streptomyces acidipaludis]MBY8881228.1 hypothetical protein [Streptomyces acidipaludis]
MLPEVPSPNDPHVRHLRQLFLAVTTGSFLFLIPWIAYLSVSLPSHHEVSQWRLAWVGFDGALIAAIGFTAWCAWRRLQLFIPWAIVTATLLCCDAWFDIVLDWNSDELLGSVITAVVAELPLAGLLVYVARKMLRLNVTIAWRQAGREGPVPPLSRMSLLIHDPEMRGPRRADDDRQHPHHGDPSGGRPHPVEPSESGPYSAGPSRGGPRPVEPYQDGSHRYEHTEDHHAPGHQAAHDPSDGGPDAGRQDTDREQNDDDRRHPPRRSA